MLKIGLQSIPADEAKAILIAHVIDNFGGNHLDEIVLAFEMAIAGRLDLDEKEVTAYENFSCLYVSRIMNSYRRWAILEYRQHEKVIVPAPGDRQLTNSETPKNWGQYIEQEYQHYLSFGAEKYKLWPAEFYDQLVSDGFIEKDYFRKIMPAIREAMIGDLRKEKYKLQNGRLPENSERAKFADSIRQTNVNEIEKKITDYSAGLKDGELELVAKQRSMLKLFTAAKEKFAEHIYKNQ